MVVRSRIQDLLDDASGAFSSSDDDGATTLDAEILLAHVLGCSRASVLANPDKQVTATQHAQYKLLYSRRANGEPIAYLIGTKEFWSLDLMVNPSVLVPRPETELLVQRCLYRCDTGEENIVDLGTGSGAVALAIASELPRSKVVAVDICREAVKTARCNSRSLGLENIEVVESDWFTNLGHVQFDLIAANPPYVDPEDPHLTGTIRYEPREALVAGEHGLSELKKIIRSGPSYLINAGWLLLEHGYDQASSVRDLLNAAGFETVRTYRDVAGRDRVTEGQLRQS